MESEAIVQSLSEPASRVNHDTEPASRVNHDTEPASRVNHDTEPAGRVNHDKVDSEENCTSLARSDSGQGQSLGSFECNGENNFLRANSYRGDSSDIINEIIDHAQRVTGSNNLVSNHENPGPSKERMFLDIRNNLDSGIEKSPKSEHFPFSQFDKTPTLEEQDESSNDLQENCDMHSEPYQRNLKYNFEGPVSVLSNGEKSTSERTKHDSHTCQDNANSNLSVKANGVQRTTITRQSSFDSSFALDFPPLDRNSFDGDKPMIAEEGSFGPPDMSIMSSTHSCQKNCQHISRTLTKEMENCSQDNPSVAVSCNNRWSGIHDSTCQDKIAQQNGHSQKCWTVSCIPNQAMPGNSTEHSYLPVPSHGMVAQKYMDQLARELVMVRTKLNESQRENSHLFLRNRQLESENSKVSEIMRAHADLQFQLQTCMKSMAIIQEHAESQQNKAKEELDLKQQKLQAIEHELKISKCELEAARHELESKQRDLEDKQRELGERQHDLDCKQHELDSLLQQYNELELQNQDLKKHVDWLTQEVKTMHEEEEVPDLNGVLQVRISPNRSDQTQVRMSDNSDQTQLKRPFTDNN